MADGVALSVVVPCYNAGADLDACLRSLKPRLAERDECIVVDDGSTDGSADRASDLGFTVVSTGGRRGPAVARNLGARHARNAVLLFLDSDVSVHDPTLEKFRGYFGDGSEPAAVFGSYDDSPHAKGLVSEYRNLLHCYTHHTARQDAWTFWAGCGAMRRDVFEQLGGFDESFGGPSVEDIELGYRATRAGFKIRLDPSIRVQHRKRWTFFGMIRTDVFCRAIPWTRLILRDASLPNDLNVRASQRVCVALSGLLAACLAVSPWMPVLLAPAAAATLGIAWVNRDFYSWLARRKGWSFALRAIPLHILYFFYSGVAFLYALLEERVRRISPSR
jgi:glycosyltransferase involved in cell wall biosynthesis